MFVKLEEIIENVKEAESVSVIYASDPSAEAGAKMLAKIPHVRTHRWNSYGFSRKALPPKEMLSEYNIFLGIHHVHPDGVKGINWVQVTDVVSLHLQDEKSFQYICNKKNLPACPYIKTTSHAHFGYLIASEFGKEPTKEEALELLLGDFDDNMEIGPTEFQKEIAEYIGLENEVPNFVRSLGKYQLFDFLPAAVHLDLTRVFDFEYEVSNGTVKNRFPTDEILIENPKKLEEKLQEWGLNGEFIYSYEIDGESVAEKHVKDPKILKNDLELGLKIYQDCIMRFEAFKNETRLLKAGEIRMFYFPSDKDVMSFYDLLLLFPNNSILVVGSLSSPEKAAYGIFSKSEIHVGFLATFAGASKYKGNTGHGSGERWKGYMKRRQNYRMKPQFPITVPWVIEDIMEESKNRVDLHHKASWYALNGYPAYTVVRNQPSTLHPPFWEPGYKEWPTREEVEEFLAKYPNAVKLSI